MGFNSGFKGLKFCIFYFPTCCRDIRLKLTNTSRLKHVELLVGEGVGFSEPWARDLREA